MYVSLFFLLFLFYFLFFSRLFFELISLTSCVGNVCIVVLKMTGRYAFMSFFVLIKRSQVSQCFSSVSTSHYAVSFKLSQDYWF